MPVTKALRHGRGAPSLCLFLQRSYFAPAGVLRHELFPKESRCGAHNRSKSATYRVFTFYFVENG